MSPLFGSIAIRPMQLPPVSAVGLREAAAVPDARGTLRAAGGAA